MNNDIINALEILPNVLNTLSNYKIEQLKLVTLDNPGWYFSFNTSVPLLKKSIDWVKLDNTEDDWIYWRVNNNCFEFACSTRNLSKSFMVFFNHISEYINHKFKIRTDGIISHLEDWFYVSCNGDWEHTGGVKLFFKQHVWQLDVDFYDLNYDCDDKMISSHYDSDCNWFKCWTKDGHFFGNSTCNNLHEIVYAFVDYVNRQI